MPPSGMGMMLKSMGLDPDELKANVETFMQHMKEQADKINANQARLEEMITANQASLNSIAQILSGLSTLVTTQNSTTHILDEEGKKSGVLITSEKFPQEMLDDVYEIKTTTAGGEPKASNFDAVQPIGGQHGRRERSNNEE